MAPPVLRTSRRWAGWSRLAAVKPLVCGFYRRGPVVAGFRTALVFAAYEQGGNRVLEDQLGLRVVFQHDGVLVKRAHAARNYRTVQQMHSNLLPARKSYVEKRFLNVDY